LPTSARVTSNCGLISVTSVAAGSEHTLLLTASGEVWSAGNGASGALGHGSYYEVRRMRTRTLIHMCVERRCLMTRGMSFR
jgi:alpha-tubulin suppressor-like RCC1 family protein